MTRPERIAALVGLALVALAAVPIDRATAVAPPVATPPPDAPINPADLSLVLHSADLRMTTAVTVDGKGPFNFIVDTGATRSVVSHGLADAAGLPVIGHHLLYSTGGVGEVDLVRVERLRMGQLAAVGPVDAPLLDAANIGAPGMLGLDVLGRRQVVLDLAGNRMTVERTEPQRRPDIDEIVVTARRRYGALLLVDASIDGQPIIVILDTGASGTIGNMALKAKLATRHGDPTPTRTIQLLDVAGHVMEAQAAQLPTIRIGGLRMKGAPAAFSDVETFRQFGLIDRPAMLLGMDVLRLFRRVAIDFGAKKVRFLLQ